MNASQPLRRASDDQSAPAHLARLVETSAFSISEFRCPGAPELTGVEQAPYPEIVLPRLGSYLRIDETGEVLLNKGVLAFFEANRPYTIRHLRAAPDLTTVISITDVAALHEAVGVHLPNGRAFARSAVRAPADLMILHRRMLNHLGKGASETLAAEECGAEIILCALNLNLQSAAELSRRGAAPARSSADHFAYADGAAHFLAERYADPVTLEDTAAAVGLSPFHLCRVFQAVNGTTVRQYLLTLRLDAAVERLLETSDSITEIAHAVGFSSHSHLTALFTRTFGVPPRTLRERGAGARPLASRSAALAGKGRRRRTI